MPGGRNQAELTAEKEQYWVYRRESGRLQIPRGQLGVVNRFVILVISEEYGAYSSCT